MTRIDDWFLTAKERGNPATRLDARRGDGIAWSEGNDVRPLIHGVSYFGELLALVSAMTAGDLLLFTDWRGDPDEWLAADGTEVSGAFCAAARRGVLVRGLVWRSHLDRFKFSARENRHLGEEINAAGGECLLDMRVRPGGSHHMKLVVLRHQSRPGSDVAFVGGIDLCHSRRDDGAHGGDPQAQPMAAVYSRRPPWHDVQAMIRGPAVGDVETVFRERWEDPAPLSRNPMHRLRDLATGQDRGARPLPPQRPDPEPCGRHAVQLLRTYPFRRAGYCFAPDGERSIARAYQKVLPRARSLVYLEDQYLWSATVVRALAAALRSNQDLRLIAVIPMFPDQDGRFAMPPNLIGRADALRELSRAGGPRVAVYCLENETGTPVYVHAKVCIVDDTWAIVGSDNFNRRSWTHDSELSCAVIDDAVGPDAGLTAGREPGRDAGPGTGRDAGPGTGRDAGPGTGRDAGPAAGRDAGPAAGRDAGPGAGPGAGPAGMSPGAGADTYARRLRMALGAEHVGALAGADLASAEGMVSAFRQAAAGLDRWHEAGRPGPRPPGQLRRYPDLRMRPWTRAWASVPYRLVFDPDGRPPALRRAGQF